MRTHLRGLDIVQIKFNDVNFKHNLKKKYFCPYIV